MSHCPPTSDKGHYVNFFAPAGLSRGAVRVLDDLRTLERDQPPAPCFLEERVEPGERRADLLFRVDDLDEDRQVFREAQDLGGVDAAGGAITLDATPNRRACQAELARRPHDHLVEGATMVTVRLSDEDAKQLTLAGYLPGSENTADDLAEPGPGQTGADRRPDVADPQGHFPIAQERHRLIAEGRHRGETPAEAD